MITLLLAAWLAVAILAGLAIAAALRCGRRLDFSVGTPTADQAAIHADTRPGSDHNTLAACEAIWNTREEDAA